MTTIDVMYIGHKPFKEDNVAGTGTVWHGHGDVQPVPSLAWPRLAQHAAVWRIADGITTSVSQAAIEQPAQAVLAGSLHDNDVFHIAPGIDIGREQAILDAFKGTELQPGEWNQLSAQGRTNYVDDYLSYRRQLPAARQAWEEFFWALAPIFSGQGASDDEQSKGRGEVGAATEAAHEHAATAKGGARKSPAKKAAKDGA